MRGIVGMPRSLYNCVTCYSLFLQLLHVFVHLSMLHARRMERTAHPLR